MNINFGLHSQRKGGFKFMRYQPHIARLVIPLSANHGLANLVLLRIAGQSF